MTAGPGYAAGSFLGSKLAVLLLIAVLVYAAGQQIEALLSNVWVLIGLAFLVIWWVRS